MVIDNIWIYRKSWIGVLQWAQGMLQSQDYLWHALSLGFGQVIWSRCVTCKWQVNKEMQIIGEVGRKREVEQEGRITAWRSSGLPRREQGGKHASLKGDSKCCYCERDVPPLVPALEWAESAGAGVPGSGWAVLQMRVEIGKTYEKWLGNPGVEICFVLHLLTLRGIPGGSSLPVLSSDRAECFQLCLNQKAEGRICLPMGKKMSYQCWWGILVTVADVSWNALGLFAWPEFWCVFLLKISLMSGSSLSTFALSMKTFLIWA